MATSFCSRYRTLFIRALRVVCPSVHVWQSPWPRALGISAGCGVLLRGNAATHAVTNKSREENIGWGVLLRRNAATLQGHQPIPWQQLTRGLKSPGQSLDHCANRWWNAPKCTSGFLTGTTMKTRVLLCALLTLALGGSSALAAPGVALVEVALDGTFTAREQVDLHLHVHRTLAGLGLQLVGPEQVEIALGGRSPASCQDDRCRIDLARILGVPRLVFAHLRAESRGVTVRLVLFNADVGERTATASRFAPSQSKAALTQAIAEAAEALFRAEPKVSPARIAVRTRPTGARITVDGRPLGAGDAELPVAAGKHVVTLEKEGYGAMRLNVEVRPGEVTTLDVVLPRQGEPGSAGAVSPSMTPPPGATQLKKQTFSARPLRVAGWSIVAVGLASIATGLGLFAYSCTPEPGAVRCPVKASVRTAGRALIFAGAGLELVGAGAVAYDLHLAKQQRVRLSLGLASASAQLEF